MDEKNFPNKTEEPPRHGEDDLKDRRLRDEEFASEFTADTSRDMRDEEVISMYGWIGIALALFSFFMWPVIFGGAAIILGFVSRSTGAKVLGNIAITLGVIAMLFRFILIPLF